MERYLRDELESYIWDWVDGTLPPAQNGRTVRMAFGKDQLTFDPNLASYFRGDRFQGPLGIRFNRILLVNGEMLRMHCQPEPDMNVELYQLPEKAMNKLHSLVTALRSNASKATVKKFNAVLDEFGLGKTFIVPHPKNKLITKYRVRNALDHYGSKAAVTYEVQKDEIYSVVFWDSIDDAILERLANPKIANVLEL